MKLDILFKNLNLKDLNIKDLNLLLQILNDLNNDIEVL